MTSVTTIRTMNSGVVDSPVRSLLIARKVGQWAEYRPWLMNPIHHCAEREQPPPTDAARGGEITTHTDGVESQPAACKVLTGLVGADPTMSARQGRPPP
jgi:hypothetical protein